MDDKFERLVPQEFRKIAQNDSALGDPIAVVYYAKNLNQYYMQAQKIAPDGSYVTMTFGPIPAHVFDSLAHIMSDVNGMEKRYYYLD